MYKETTRVREVDAFSSFVSAYLLYLRDAVLQTDEEEQADTDFELLYAAYMFVMRSGL